MLGVYVHLACIGDILPCAPLDPPRVLRLARRWVTTIIIINIIFQRHLLVVLFNLSHVRRQVPVGFNILSVLRWSHECWLGSLGSLSTAVLRETELWLAAKKRIFVVRFCLKIIGALVLWIDEFVRIDELFCVLVANNHLAELVIVKVIMYFATLMGLFLLRGLHLQLKILRLFQRRHLLRRCGLS